MASLAVEGYDIIGDVHGCATQLEELLTKLGYGMDDGAAKYRHPSRQAIFVGDLIDNGDEHLRVLEVVKAMVDAGSAQIVLGNHEFNALGYHTEWPLGSGKYVRAHDDPDNEWSEKNTRQHQPFLDQVTGVDQQQYLEWFKTIPLWLDLGGLRVVHACWHADSIAVVEQHFGSNTPFADIDHLVAATIPEDDPLPRAVATLLKGPEISLINHGQPAFHDKKGVSRDHARVQWWNRDGRTLRDIAVIASDATTACGKPYPRLPAMELLEDARSFVYTDKIPVVYGHYWRQWPPKHRHDWTDYTACVDFSAVGGGKLTAYRWSGESQIQSGNFVTTGDP